MWSLSTASAYWALNTEKQMVRHVYSAYQLQQNRVNSQALHPSTAAIIRS